MGKYKFGQESQKVLDTVNKYLEKTAHRMISKSVIDASIPEWGGFRTDSYQNEIFEKNWSKADGYIKKSDHQKKNEDGKCPALDVCAYVNGKQNWNKQRLIYLGMLMQESFKELKDEDEIPENLYLHCGMYWINTYDNMGWDLPHFFIMGYPQKIGVKS